MDKLFEIELQSEICCDYCDEIIHNHFKCPICEKNYASTDAYDYFDEYETKIGCEECGSNFIVIERYYPYFKVKLEDLGGGVNDQR